MSTFSSDLREHKPSQSMTLKRLLVTERTELHVILNLLTNATNAQ